MKRFIWILFTAVFCLSLPHPVRSAPQRRFTVMCYMNGDNNLTQEVLHAVDMMETVGSSENLNIMVLVDGGTQPTPIYGKKWQGTKLLHISTDPQIGVITSEVIADLGDRNLADPLTLRNFILECRRYPAEKYLFFLFSHGRGIIDTQTLKLTGSSQTARISSGDAEPAIMTQEQFHDAIKGAMGETRFDLMVLFSCLTNMVEIGYSLRDTTRYLVASEDEIRIVNNPPGTFQIRGIKFEVLLERLRTAPDLSVKDLGKLAVDDFIAQYTQDVLIPGQDHGFVIKRFPGGLSLIDCTGYDRVALRLDALARHVQSKMKAHSNSRPMLTSFCRALIHTQRYASFLNLEYYDLLDFLTNLNAETVCPGIRRYCGAVKDEVSRGLILYEKHTNNYRSKGVSIYLSHPSIPDNIFQSHQKMYQACAFSRKTAWDEMIALYRKKMSGIKKK